MIFDVNETLSDMGPIADSFGRVGLGAGEAEAWFAGVLRDGFALACRASNPAFAEVAAEGLRGRLVSVAQSEEAIESGVQDVMGTFQALTVHDDVVAGVQALQALGIRLVTLSNGSTSVAGGLLERAGIRDGFERLLSVEDAPAWKPAPGSYDYALTICEVAPAEAMLVAVHPWDIDGAARSGLRTCWLDRNNSRYPGYFTPPELKASDLPRLAQLLAEPH